MTKRTNRAYKKGIAHRDHRKFIIVAEGDREDDYFGFFENINQRIIIAIVKREGGKSAAKFLLERLDAYDQEYGIENEDFIWFVLDVDRWPRNTINELIDHCMANENYNVSISNPSFEVWLHYHLLEKIPDTLNTAAKLKSNLPKIISGGYNRDKFISLIEVAIENAYKADENKKQQFPDLNKTKVYTLSKTLIEFLGKNWR